MEPTTYRLAHSSPAGRTHVVNCGLGIGEGTLAIALCRRSARLGPPAPLSSDEVIACEVCANKFRSTALREGPPVSPLDI